MKLINANEEAKKTGASVEAEIGSMGAREGGGGNAASIYTDPDLAVVYGLYARVYLWLGGFEDGLSGELPAGNDAYALAAEYGL